MLQSLHPRVELAASCSTGSGTEHLYYVVRTAVTVWQTVSSQTEQPQAGSQASRWQLSLTGSGKAHFGYSLY